METKEWSFADKSGWPDGPWMREPDKLQWLDEATGLPCLVHRGPSGALCGYVAVDTTHPLHGLSYSARVPKPEGFDARRFDEKTGALALFCEALREEDGKVSLGLAAQVHGGLTYADACMTTKRDNGSGVCHIPAPGEPDNVWWFGFDCAHAGDFCPEYMGLERNGVYRDLEYVKQECRNLALQLKEWTA